MEQKEHHILLSEITEDTQYQFTPQTFEHYIGQQELKNKLSIFTQAALMRQEALDHLLLFGPPGLGKTTLAQLMAKVLNVQLKICSGPMLERTGDLVALLSSLAPRDILFIDEIHRLPIQVEEVLYSAMEQFRVDVIIGQGAGAQSVNLPLAPFTLIGATTKSGMISAPLRSRFGIVERLDFYTPQELADIVKQNAAFLKIQLSDAAAMRIAQGARGTPRIAKRIIRRVRDFAQVKQTKLPLVATDELVAHALQVLGIDADGLTTVDNILLFKLLSHFNGGPAGLETLASLIAEDTDTLEQVYEPFLLRSGYLEKTSRGRQIPHKKVSYLKRKFFGQQTLLDQES